MNEKGSWFNYPLNGNRISTGLPERESLGAISGDIREIEGLTGFGEAEDIECLSVTCTPQIHCRRGTDSTWVRRERAASNSSD
jgi:hypothetical protein